MNIASAKRKLAWVVKELAEENRADLEERKMEQSEFERPDFIWHYLLQSFATMGRAAGSDGLIRNKVNYNQLTYPALQKLTPKARLAQAEKVCRAAKVRMPSRKAEFIVECFDQIENLGGLKGAKAALVAAKGREAKIKFLTKFHGIGKKYARNIMMDVYHEDFRDSIALDVRIRAIATGLGVKFKTYEEEEQFFLDAAKLAGVNGWELDRLLFNYRAEVEERLGIKPAKAKKKENRAPASEDGCPSNLFARKKRAECVTRVHTPSR